MNFWCISACFVTLCGVGKSSYGGDFYMTIDKIDNHPEIPREYADWHFYIKRISKKDKIIDGFYNIKKDIVGPKVVITTYILSNNKFYKMALNEVVSTNMCDEEVKKKFVVPYFEGNSSYAMPNDCVIRKGHMRVKPNARITMDSLAHKMMNKTIYGTYKLVMKFQNKESKTVAASTWTVTAKKKE